MASMPLVIHQGTEFCVSDTAAKPELNREDILPLTKNDPCFKHLKD